MTEEVRVGKQVTQDTEQVSGEVRKEELKVDRTGNVDVKNRGTDKPPGKTSDPCRARVTGSDEKGGRDGEQEAPPFLRMLIGCSRCARRSR